jgi:FkbM family methyltransferase
LHRPYEPLTTRAFLEALRPHGAAVDVGAHIGYYACLAAKTVGPAGVVHAVEPWSENAAMIRRNALLNDVSNVIVHPLAASDRRETREFTIAGSSDSHSLYPHPLSPAVGTTTVEAAPIDDLIDAPVDVIKIDVEGGEAAAIRGMTRLLAGSPGARVLVEWNPGCLESAGTVPAALPALLQKAGIADLQVLDDRAGKIRDLSDVLFRVQEGQVPDAWYVTLMGRVVSREHPSPN